MTRYLLDTNHLSPLITPGHPLRIQVDEHMAKGDKFTVSTIVVSEFMFGIGSLPRAKQNRQEWQKLRPTFFYIGVNLEMAEEAANLRLKLQKQGWQLKLPDAIIAVTALRNQYTLLTADKDFTAIDNLSVENWRT